MSFLLFLVSCAVCTAIMCGGLEWGPANESKGKMVLSSAVMAL
ncbi:hypothetical protein POPTR_001G379150v4 [Populus trichocarpa]|uniref:Uncharacterized protein n=1 Tax=Populus trichocarpa TaxID=3694 RepID=A0ACC0TPI2_POPTR|nr:hypothetical protein POPTR_001G379150v4 [Populus trichocarpa]